MKKDYWLSFLMIVGIALLVVSFDWKPEFNSFLEAAIFGNKEVDLFGSVQLNPVGIRGLKLECYCVCKCKDRDGDGMWECDQCWCRNCQENGIEATETPWPTQTPGIPQFPTSTFEPYPLPTWPALTPYP